MQAFKPTQTILDRIRADNTFADVEKLKADVDYIAMMTNVDIHDDTQENDKNEEHSKYFYLVKKYYDEGLWSKKKVHDAIGKWITEEEYKEIVGENQ